MFCCLGATENDVSSICVYVCVRTLVRYLVWAPSFLRLAITSLSTLLTMASGASLLYEQALLNSVPPPGLEASGAELACSPS